MALKTINCPFLAYTSKNNDENYDWLGGWTRADENATYDCAYFVFEPPNTTGLSGANAWQSLNFQGKFYIEDIQVGEGRCNISLQIDKIYELWGDITTTDGEPVINSYNYLTNPVISTSSSSHSITQSETLVTKTVPLNYDFGYDFESIGVHTKTSTDKQGIWTWDKYRVCLKNKNYSSLQLSFSYTPGCYVNYTNTGETTISRQTCTNEAYISWPTKPTRTGYRFNGWIIDNVLHNPEDPNTSIYQTEDKDITATGDWIKLYQVIFNSSLNGVTVNYTQSSYNQMLVNAIVQKPTNPSTPTYQFMGWTSDSTKTIYDPTWHDTNSSINKFWNTSTNLPNIASNQAGSTPTTEGFPINYYAVWRERDSVTINPSVADITAIAFNTTPSAQDGLTYYFDRGLNKKVTLSINANATGSEEYYINSVSGATGTITANGRRSWVGNNSANTGSSAIATTINITYHKNLQFYLHNYFLEWNNYGPSYLSMNFSFSYSGTYQLATEETNTTTNYNDFSKSFYLNPGDSVTCTVETTDPRYYLARIHIPNTTTTMSSVWDGIYSNNSFTINNTLLQDRIALRNGYSGNNTTLSVPSNTVSDLRKYTYILTIPTDSTGISLMGDTSIHKIERAYGIFEPFHCIIKLYNTNYTPNTGWLGGLTKYECEMIYGGETNLTVTCRFFNDITLINNQGVYCQRNSSANNYIITNIMKDGVSLGFEDPMQNQNQENKLVNLIYFPSLDTVTIGNYNYYLNKFTEFYIQPDSNLLQTYHEPISININWATAYKYYIILRLPEANEDNNTTETDLNLVTNKISYDSLGWIRYNKTNENKQILLRTPETSSSSTIINTIQDIANSGYILKNIKKYRYNGTYNSTLSTTTVTREELDSGTGSLPSGWSRSTSDNSNDILTLNQNNLVAGSVDYYFITYEEGLPVFYPDDENNPKRAIQLYWEGNRAIGLYYENTRLL